MVDITAFESGRCKAKPTLSNPLTYVPFFVAKHRALKFAKAKLARRGLPPPKSAAKYIDMSVVRNFEHYDDIGSLPNDPVVKDKARREAMEASALRKQEATAKKVRQFKMSAEAHKQALDRAANASKNEEYRRAVVWVESTKNIWEGDLWQSVGGSVNPVFKSGPKKSKPIVIAEDDGGNENEDDE